MISAGLTIDDAELLKWRIEDLAAFEWQARWTKIRKGHQVQPEGDWTVWALIAGRGAGKTRTAAETLGQWAWTQPKTRWLVSGRTTADMRGTCFEGESGLVAVIPPELIADYNKSLFELTLINGSLIKGIAAETPEAFRGPQFHGGWCDELAAWQNPQATWDMMMMGMRLGQHPRIIVSTTPKPLPLIKQMVDKQLSVPCVVTKASSYDNIENLAPTFRAQLLQYEGTQLGRQEIHAEIIDSEEGGIIRRSWWQLWDAKMPLPAFDEIVMSLDTAFTEEARNKDKQSQDYGKADYTACSVWGLFHAPTSKGSPWRGTRGAPGIILLDCWQERLGLPDLIAKVKKSMTDKYGGEEQRPTIKPMFGRSLPTEAGRPTDTLIIEDKGSGISLRQMLVREGIYAHAYNPGRAKKLERLHAVSHLFAHGAIYVVESEKNPGKPRNWAEPLISQVCSFSGEGSLEHDDYVDATSQALRYLADHDRMSMTVKPDPEEWDRKRDSAKARENPYAN